MFSSRLAFVCTMCVVSVAATAGAASSQAESAAPRAAAMPWTMFVYLIQELEVILFGDEVPPARDGFASAEKVRAEGKARRYVANNARAGIRDSISSAEARHAELTMDDLLGLLGGHPGMIDRGVEDDLRATIADQRTELGL